MAERATFDFRWGLPILDAARDGQYLYNFILRNYIKAGVTHEEFLFILHLSAYHYDSANSMGSFPSLDKIAEQMGVTPQRIYQIEQALERKDLLQVERRPGKTSIYTAARFATICLEAWQDSQGGKENYSGKGYLTTGGKIYLTGVVKDILPEEENKIRTQNKKDDRATEVAPLPPEKDGVSRNPDPPATIHSSPRPLLPPAAPPPLSQKELGRQAKREQRQERKGKMQTMAERVAAMPPGDVAKIRSYLDAYLIGIGLSGARPKRADDAMVLSQWIHVIDIDTSAYPPNDFGSAARYFHDHFKGRVSPKTVRAHLAEWDALGRPRGRVGNGADGDPSQPIRANSITPEEQAAIYHTLQAYQGGQNGRTSAAAQP